MKAAIYNRFWQSMGGGERHSAMIAQLLSQRGVEVDLLGHQDVSLSELGSRLGLDLSATNLRVTPDRGSADISELSAEYDLFINATYMSRVEARSARAAYLCFFPTPADHDLTILQRAAVRVLGPFARLPEARTSMRHGTGWYPTEGGRRRKWSWSNGDARLSFEAGPLLAIQADFGRPGSPGPVEVAIEDSNGTPLTSLVVKPEFEPHVIEIPAAEKTRVVRLRSNTFSPGDGDHRELGFALSRLSYVGTRYTPAEHLGERFPWLTRDRKDVDFAKTYDVILANSVYTQEWISRLWQCPSEVLFPPIEVERITPSAERTKTILSVGRFFAPGYGHSKRQLEMVAIFKDLVRSGQLPGWKLCIVGGCEESQQPYLDRVRQAAQGLPVEIHANAARAVVESLMSTASIFWSATGLGEDTERKPWTNEHFGMTTAEAMAGGCVPVVIDRAGQREIVREAVDGFRWADPEQCRIRTVQVATDEALRARLSASAIDRVQAFSEEAFSARWNELAEAHQLMTPLRNNRLP
jgi:glycosyltransferase involved in cell wall biosynthesis